MGFNSGFKGLNNSIVFSMTYTNCCTYRVVPTDGGGLGSSVGIVTDYGLDCPGIESRWETRFSAPVQTGPVAHQPPVQWVPGLSRGLNAAGACC